VPITRVLQAVAVPLWTLDILILIDMSYTHEFRQKIRGGQRVIMTVSGFCCALYWLARCKL